MSSPPVDGRSNAELLKQNEVNYAYRLIVCTSKHAVSRRFRCSAHPL
jgi:hypothetical protein